MNQSFLESARRQNQELADLKTFKQVRPSDALLDEYYSELITIWDGLLAVFPQLQHNPLEMRVHNPKDDAETTDHVLFWPIGQEMVAKPIRMLLDKAAGARRLTGNLVEKALAPLGEIPWDLHGIPWRGLLLIRKNDSWIMRSEGRTDAVKTGQKLLMWLTGTIEFAKEGVQKLRGEWEWNLYTDEQDAKERDEWWSEVEQIKLRASGRHL